MGLSLGHMLILGVVVLIVFGAGKLPQVMGDLAKGLRAFKDGMRDGQERCNEDRGANNKE